MEHAGGELDALITHSHPTFSSLTSPLPAAPQLETWLRVVFAPHCEIDGTAQIAAIRSRLDSGGGPDPAPARGGSVSASTLSLLSAARKRGPVGEAPSWMGSTTTANRAKKSKLNNGAAGGTSIVRPGVEAQPLGHSFLRIDLDTVLQGAPVVVLRAALKTRLKFDAWAAGKLAEHELEEKRLVQEKADFRMFDAKDKAGDSRSQKIIEEISIGVIYCTPSTSCPVLCVMHTVLDQYRRAGTTT